jgi:acetyltransferase-like isoleucine patch superfamily enzyme
MAQANNESSEYREIRYLQFNKSRAFRVCERIAGVLTWPLLWPIAMLARRSDILFRTISELLSIVPYLFGIIARYEFYRFALLGVGENVQIEFGVVFIEREVSIGSNVLIGRYCIVHHCDFGDFVLVGERCTFLSGSRQHSFKRQDTPMALQGGQKKKIYIGQDCWIGSHAIIMEDVAGSSIVAAGAVVTKSVSAGDIVGGNPATVIGQRRQ